jgi:hypothetical protein
MDIYVPQEEGAEPKELVDRLDEAEGRMRTLLLDTNKLAAASALATVKFHELSFERVSQCIQPVSHKQGGSPSGLIRRKQRYINAHMNISSCINPPLR